MRELKIAYGNSCFATKWSNKTVTFEALCERLKTTTRTTETIEEYPKLPKADRDRIKDMGGFVAAALKGGRRKRENVVCRSMITLDGDKASVGFIDQFETAHKYASCLYTTHGHTPEAPRVRVIIPLSRDATPDEWNAISRHVAYDLGIDQFDECSYRPHQLMYWPSTPANGEYIFKSYDGEWLDPDKILAEHPNWRDCSLLPTSSRESDVVRHDNSRQQDPLAKEGIVGTFCRAYSVEDAISEFLQGIYAPSVMAGRYDYTQADSSAGVVLYESKWVFSHHATDPACGKLLNAFDLVRVHKFSDLDEKAGFKAMSEFAVSLDKVKILLDEERKSDATADFATEDKDWRTLLKYQSKSRVLENSVWNLMLIFKNDPDFQNFAYNELANRVEVIGEVPWERPNDNSFWRDADIAQLKAIIDMRYLSFSSRNHDVCFSKVTDDRRFHPIRDYLNSLPPWDGYIRVETLLIDHLGAEDTAYTRAVTRKTIVAAVARVFVPGIKFDSVLVMDGPQEKGKSTLFNKLASDKWFNDGLTLTDMQDKSGAEKLQGYWILEIGELTGMRKSDIDSVKSFISRRDDKYRASYGRVVESHPRQSIIVATVNSMGGFLRDPTGNRRFWPVKTPGGTTKHSWNVTDDDVKQIWAEALALWKAGEKLYLEGDVKDSAASEQNSALETDPREGHVLEYLELLLPEDWDGMDIYRRREFVRGDGDLTQPKGTKPRDSVCAMEIWCECFGKDVSAIKRADSYEVSTILRKLGWIQSDSSKRLPLYGKQRIWNKP